MNARRLRAPHNKKKKYAYGGQLGLFISPTDVAKDTAYVCRSVMRSSKLRLAFLSFGFLKYLVCFICQFSACGVLPVGCMDMNEHTPFEYRIHSPSYE